MQKAKKILTVLLISTVAVSAYAEKADKYDNAIMFGESLSDVGNNTWVISNGHVGTPITNQNKADHRRPLWINYVLDLLLPDKTLYHSSQIKSNCVNPKKDNISYAWASAETGMHYINDDEKNTPFPNYNDNVCSKHGPGLIEAGNACVPGVRQEVAQYLSDVKYHPNPKSIFIFWAGGNDIMNNLLKLTVTGRSIQDGLLRSLSVTDENQPGYEDLSYPIINMMKAKNDLIDAGVAPDHIFLLDFADASELPGIIKLDKVKPGIIKLMHAISVAYNANLYKAMTNMNTKYDLSPSHIYSSYAFLNSIINDPEKYGFQNVTDSCIDNGALPFCDGYAFYNDKHPTVTLAKVLAQDVSKMLVS